ncbi:HAD family hydrolase [Ruficoccus sp. ZRK36]|uniref:HAD family hydrolase n=1 Tax=Ruficoccus sp. ZRK36 TaxID=2866311 RepID=UPI001C73B56F|nr:HAD family hydrolase [Ruficoccus sp. ZRK36]QYY35900.1 HAD family hydrolase [Ruficoccus sp. ZRK36]
MSVKTPLPEIFRENALEAMEPESTGQKPSVKKLSGIRAVLFDVYGTLFQSGVGDISLAEEGRDDRREKIIRACMKEAGLQVTDQKTPVAELFHDTIRAEQDIRREQGVDFPEVDILGVWEDLVGQLEAYELIRGRASRAALRSLAVHYEACVNPAAPMPGALETIEGLLDKKQSLGIVSNAQFYTPLLFEAFLEGSPHDLGFEEILCVWSYQETVAKPSPKLFEVAAERLQALDGIAPKETLYIGNDMRNDIAPASKLGFKTALFAGDKRSLRLRKDDESCKGVKPDLVITELEQLLECF